MSHPVLSFPSCRRRSLHCWPCGRGASRCRRRLATPRHVDGRARDAVASRVEVEARLDDHADADTAGIAGAPEPSRRGGKGVASFCVWALCATPDVIGATPGFPERALPVERLARFRHQRRRERRCRGSAWVQRCHESHLGCNCVTAVRTQRVPVAVGGTCARRAHGLRQRA